MLNWISVPEAARMLGVDRSTVFRWVKLGRLTPSGYVDRKPIFDPEYIRGKVKELSKAVVA